MNPAVFGRGHGQAPFTVTVEARDNDTIAGPKWGKSPPLTVILPQVGEPEALRYAALLKARGAITDLLSDRLLQKAPEVRARAEHLKHETDAQEAAVKEVQAALGGTYGGLPVRGRMGRTARGRMGLAGWVRVGWEGVGAGWCTGSGSRREWCCCSRTGAASRAPMM